MDKELNRQRVAEWRNRKYSKGCKSLRVYLEPRIREKVAQMRFFYQLRGRTSELITMAIETLYQKFLSERSRND
jgi:hypothetical protein